MKELFSQLRENEKSFLRLLGLLLLIAIIFFLVASLGQRRSYHQLDAELRARQKAAAAAVDKRAESAAQWALWEEAYTDIKDLRARYFYPEDKEINQLRLDLEKIFAESGINARSLRYNRVYLEREKVTRVDVSFSFPGSYMIFKRFLQTVERFPRFLVLEKFDFMKISPDGSLLDLKIVLAAYYANF